jgi:uncharacterized protein YbbC (DUF1343 family)/CubicO group peptidase (beta-lactamase class C family)
VVVVGRGDVVVWRKAYGFRQTEPTRERMTLDTVFDVASLTKVVATAPAVMQLVEQGRLRLTDAVAAHIPAFGKYGKERITVRDLLTHMSGLRPDVDLGDPWDGRDTAIRLATEETPLAPPGRRFIYSDINYFLLAEVVARVSGEPFDAYVRTRLFQPLGMRDTMFTPSTDVTGRVAPTEPGTPRGVVHDPTARRMAGVAGHAGLFSTASDLTRFCRMLLAGGSLEGTRVLAPLSIARMTSPATPAGEPNVRGFGWDIDSSFSANRGELLPLGSYGHTGFTGTSIWIDPATRLFVVFLSNRLHPDGRGDVTPLRARVATVAAAALVDVPAAVRRDAAFSRERFASPTAGPMPAPPALTGIDVLRADGFAALKGLRVALLTNHAGRAKDGATTIDLLASAPDVRLVSLFSPEHGIRGQLDERVPSSRDDRTGVPIHSLYGATLRPDADMLDGLDAVVVDLPDVGARFYTYATTMAYVIEAAAARRLKVVVLDRPNPIGGVQIEGPPADEAQAGFTAYFPSMPIRHSLTLGELARLFNGERRLGADLTVVPMRGWTRDAWFDDTGQPWVNPSPNMRTLYAAALYPGLGAFEGTNISVGRGTDKPFEQIGAPWIDGVALAAALNARRVPGVGVHPLRFTPSSSKYAGVECGGVFFVVTDRGALRPVRLGVEVASALVKLYGARFEIRRRLPRPGPAPRPAGGSCARSTCCTDLDP